MKKILISVLFILATALIHAQEKKPNKDATIKYLNNIVQASLGKEWLKSEGKVNVVQITANTVSMQTVKGCVRSWANIPWHEFSKIDVYDSKIIVRFKVAFSSKYSCPRIEGEEIIHGAFEFNEPESDFFIFISEDRIEGFKKGCLRLAEIAKEENIDPFKN